MSSSSLPLRHRVLRREAEALRGHAHHGRPPDDGEGGEAAVRRQGRRLRLRARRKEALLQKVPVRAIPRGVLAAPGEN